MAVTAALSPSILPQSSTGRFNAALIVMRLSSLGAQINRYPDRIALRIKVRPVRVAISLSLARKRPDLSFGAVTASRASNLIEGSTRVYISVVCMSSAVIQIRPMKVTPKPANEKARDIDSGERLYSLRRHDQCLERR